MANPPPTSQAHGPGHGPGRDRALLLQLAAQGLTLDDEPFARLGAPLGLGGDAVIEMLRHSMGRGLILRIGPVFAGSAAPINGVWGRALVAASRSGLPLVSQPYEALGAMLGVPAPQVQTQLADWLLQGQLLRIAAVPAHPR